MLRCLLAGVVGVVAGLGCSTSAVSVTTDFDPTVNFSQIKTYDWIPMPDSVRARPEMDAKIREVVRSQLEGKGVTQVSSDPDVLLVYRGGLQDVQFVMDGQGWSWWGGWGGDVSVREFKQGELIIDMLDSNRNQFIWEGKAQAQGDEEPTVTVVGSAVAKMFSEYPPQRK